MIWFAGPLIDGELSLRSFDPGDRETLVKERDADFHRFLGEGSDEPSPTASILVKDELVGWIDFDDDRQWLGNDEVNVGYNVFRRHRNLGYATRALLLLCDFLESQTPAVHPTLLIDPTNAVSLAVARSAGFQRTGDIGNQRLLRRVN